MFRGSLLGLLFLFSLNTGYAQAFRKVEVELKLIQKPDSASSKCVTLSLSVVNLSGDSLFIPSFRMKSIGGIHLLKKQPDGRFEEVPLLGKNNYEKWDTSEGQLKITHRWEYKDNVISKSFHRQIGEYRKQQNDILASYYDNMKNSHLKAFLEEPSHTPVLLKPHQALENLVVVSLDHYLSEPGEYKIFFQVEKAYDETDFPEKILNYLSYPIQEVHSNTLYYQVFY